MTKISSKTINTINKQSSILGQFSKLITEPLEESWVDTTPKMKILHVAAEVTPFSSVGGLSQVISYLSRTMNKRGHDVRIFMPKFGSIDEKKHKMELVHKGLRVPTGYKKGNEHPTHLTCNVKKYVREDGVIVYFLENMEYYEKRSNVYDYSDDHVRWALLAYGALKFIHRFSDWQPDIVHAHDWHSALVPNIIKTTYKKSEFYEDVATVFTIHNISYQGMAIDPDSELNFDDGKSLIPPFFSERLRRLNFLRRGILYSDIVNTVSEGYARQILTKRYGAGLEKLLLELRSKLFGIVNGMDYEKFDPETDPLLAAHFSADNLEPRKKNKAKLQKEFGLEIDPDVPLFGSVGRLDHQKGIDLLLETLEKFMKNFKSQFVLIGSGDRNLEKLAHRLAKKYPGRVGAHTYPNFTLPRLVFGGSDMMPLPSRWEPCGIVQMEAERYGSIPIVRATGGLDDTVEDFNPVTLEGNGFKFSDFDGWSLYGQMVRAVETFRNKEVWTQIQKNAMNTDNSWDSVASKYEDLYMKAIHFNDEGYIHGALIE